MISVSIAINGESILARSAVNTGQKSANPSATIMKYKVDDGSKIWHDPDDGCVALAKKMLNTIDVKAIGDAKRETFIQEVLNVKK